MRDKVCLDLSPLQPFLPSEHDRQRFLTAFESWRENTGPPVARLRTGQQLCPLEMVSMLPSELSAATVRGMDALYMNFKSEYINTKEPKTQILEIKKYSLSHIITD